MKINLEGEESETDEPKGRPRKYTKPTVRRATTDIIYSSKKATCASNTVNAQILQGLPRATLDGGASGPPWPPQHMGGPHPDGGAALF